MNTYVYYNVRSLQSLGHRRHETARAVRVDWNRTGWEQRYEFQYELDW